MLNDKQLAERNNSLWVDYQDLVRDGVRAKQKPLAKKYGISTRTVIRVLKAARKGEGITYSPKVDERVPVILSMLKEVNKEGTHFVHSFRSIGSHLNLNHKRVRQIAKANGVTQPDRDLHALRERNAPECPTDGCTKNRRWKAGKGYTPRCREHALISAKWVELSCAICSKGFSIRECEYKKRMRVSKMFRSEPRTNFYCSKVCFGRHIGMNNKGRKRAKGTTS